MQHTLTRLPRSEAELHVSVPFEEFEPQLKRAASLIAGEVTIEGFRKGKAPYDLIRARVGDSAVYERAADLAVRKTYPEALKAVIEAASERKESFTPIGQPEITVTKLAPGNELQYRAKFALLPDITLPDYQLIAQRIRVERKEAAAVTEEEINQALHWLRESRSTLSPVNRPAVLDDVVEVDFEIRHGGVKIEGGDEHKQTFVLGKARFLPGFEDAIVGMAAGDEKTFTVVAPKDWRDASFAGKALDAKVFIHVVNERVMPELTDAFAKTLGNFESIGALRTSISDGLRQDKEEKEKQRIRIAIIEEVAKESSIETPEILIASELEKMFAELRSGIEEMGMTWDNYLLHVKKTIDELKNEWREQAERRARIALVLREVAEKEQLEPGAEEIEKEANRYLLQFSTKEEAHRAIDPQELRNYTRGIVRNEKVFALLEGSLSASLKE